MRITGYLIRKEFLQILRNTFIARAVIAVPIVQMLILVPAITFEVKHVNLCVIDNDFSSASRGLVSKLEGSTFFRLRNTGFSEKEAADLLYMNKCLMILNIPTGFGREISSGNPVKIQVSVDAVNATSAQLSWSYLNAIVNDYNRELIGVNQFTGQLPGISLIGTENRYWYNEMLNYKFYMLPGILGILVTAIGFLLAGLNMVREKEIGTIEQINVTPVRKHQFIIAKMIPFLIIGIIDLSVGLIIGKIFFGIPFVGSVLLLFLSSFLFLIAVLGLGLFISTLSSTQQQYMFSAFFFMIIFILMSGIFTPFDSMPAWAQKFDIINPVAYIIRIFRMVILKGSTFFDLRFDILSLSLIAVFFTAFAVFRYRKTA